MGNFGDYVSSIGGTAAREVGGFAQGFIHSAIENPINGVVQISNRTGLTNLPELELVGAPKESSAGAIAGSALGMAADFYVMNKVGGKLMGNLGGTGMAGSALRMGIMGAVYEGVFTPSDASSDSFFSDRLRKAGVGGTTFGAMSLAASGVDALGVFRVPEARTLMGSLAYGGITGVAGGLAHAEANALFMNGRLATGQELYRDGATYGAFGAAFGAVGYAHNKLSARLDGGRTYEVTTQDGYKAQILKDAQGNVVSIEGRAPSYTSDMFDIKFRSAKMTNGSWRSSTGALFKDEVGRAWHEALPINVQSVTTGEGYIKVIESNGRVRHFENGQAYERYDAIAGKPRIGDAQVTTHSDGGRSEVKDGKRFSFDKEGRMTDFADAQGRSGNIKRGADGSIETVSFRDGNHNMYLQRNAAGEWELNYNRSAYTWKGDVQTFNEYIRNPAIEFKAADGSKVNFDFQTGSEPAIKAIMSTAQLRVGAHGNPYGTMDGQGNIVFHKGSSGYHKIIEVNGKPVEGVNEVTMRPGDTVTVRADVGDRYPVWENQTMKVTNEVTPTSNKILFNGKEVNPGNQWDVFLW